jgi:hypothetical protein
LCRAMSDTLIAMDAGNGYQGNKAKGFASQMGD